MQYDTPDAELGVRSPVPPPLPPALPPPEPPFQPAPVRQGVEFTGSAGEFFGIWFVNLVLTVLTLGIYSAWAKVRTERYFYGNTRVAGTPFEYLAQPLQILKGRLIAYAVVITLGLCAHFQIWFVYIPLFLGIMLLMPWLLQRTLRFRARYSAWRGLRFRFVEGVYEAYVNFFFRPMLQFVTLGLATPWIRMKQHEYMVSGHRFGGLRFGHRGDLGTYFIPFLIMMGMGIAGYVLIMITAVGGAAGLSALGVDLKDEAGPSGSQIAMMIAAFVPMIVVYIGFLALPVYLRTRYTNFMWQYAYLGGHRFESTLRARDVIWIYISNGLAIVFTLGLAVPWAMVRLARYRAAHFAVWVQGGIDSFAAEAERKEGAAGAELVDALDFDMDISI